VAEIVRGSGIAEADIRSLADSYIASQNVIISWCLGLTQHEHGVDTVREIVNVLLPSRQHRSGRRRTVTGAGTQQRPGQPHVRHRPPARPPSFLDRLAEVCGIDPPREHGLGTRATIEAMRRKDIKVFVALGGNFALSGAGPARARTRRLRNCDLTVQVSTKLIVAISCTGAAALILPCLGRTERDRQVSGEQGVTVEDSMAMVHISSGMKGTGVASPALRVRDPGRLSAGHAARQSYAVARLRRQLRPHP